MINNFNVNPPTPPPIFHKGNFDYISSIKYREIISVAYKAVDILEKWDFMKEDIDNYMFSNNENINQIYKKIEELGYYDHSGCSFGFTMRIIQKIAKEGEKKFMDEWLKANH